MAATGGLVKLLTRLWKHGRARLPFLFLCISVLGSTLKSNRLVPESYFSSSRNVLNVYFVKVSWGWTIALLLPFIIISNRYKRSPGFVVKRLASLLVATGLWYVWTETFFRIEDYTGLCHEAEATQAVHGDISTKAACRRAGLTWEGFDISGHSFILTYAALVIVEEMVSVLHVPDSCRNIWLECLYIVLNVVVAVCLFMFTCTSVYFHHFVDKLIGTLCGILSWVVTYHFWYPMGFSPGLPPQDSEQKKHP